MPTTNWDKVVVYAWYYDALGVAETGKPVKFKIVGAPNGVRRVDGRAIYRAGAAVTTKVGPDDHDIQAREIIRQALRDQAQAAAGIEFDGAAWDTAWSNALPALVCVSFYATDDPDITPQGWQVEVEEQVAGGKKYPIDLPLATLTQPVPGLNLGMIELPEGTPNAPAPTYAKGQPGGVAALDAEGDVLDGSGNKVGGADLSTYSQVSSLPDYPTTFPADLSGLATVATTGDYGDLTGLPTIPQAYDDAALAGRVTALEDEPDVDLSGYATTASLATVATTGSYNDLADKPAAAGGPEWGTITGTLADQSDLQAAIDSAGYDDTALSGRVTDLEGAGYITAAQVPAAPTWDTLSGKPAVIAAGTSQTAARNAIGAGTSNLQLGTGSSTAAAGDHTHTQYATTSTLSSHTGSTSNPHSVTKSQVGLGNVDNVSAANLRDRATHTGSQAISTVSNLQNELDGKVTAVVGASLVYKLQESSTPQSANLPAGSLYMTVPDGTPGAL